MHYTYVIYSSTADRYYIGETAHVEIRLLQHNTGEFKKAYTRMASDWRFVLRFACASVVDARKLEAYLKGLKSRTYIQKIVQETDVRQKFLKTVKEKLSISIRSVIVG